MIGGRCLRRLNCFLKKAFKNKSLSLRFEPAQKYARQNNSFNMIIVPRSKHRVTPRKRKTLAQSKFLEIQEPFCEMLLIAKAIGDPLTLLHNYEPGNAL